MEYLFPFEKLNVWQVARELVGIIYQMTIRFPDQERYALSVQIKRAAVSVVSNIAEGASRISKKDQAHFYQIAYGSLMEVLCQLIIATDLKYLSQKELLLCREKIEFSARMLNNLRKSRFEAESD